MRPATKHGGELSCYFNPESLPFRGPLGVLGALVALLLLKDKPSGWSVLLLLSKSKHTKSMFSTRASKYLRSKEPLRCVAFNAKLIESQHNGGQSKADEGVFDAPRNSKE